MLHELTTPRSAFLSMSPSAFLPLGAWVHETVDFIRMLIINNDLSSEEKIV